MYTYYMLKVEILVLDQNKPVKIRIIRISKVKYVSKNIDTFTFLIRSHESLTSWINPGFRINTNISVAGRLKRINRTYHIQWREEKQFQAGPSEAEERRARQSRRMENRERHQYYRHRRLLWNHDDQYYTRGDDERGNW